MEEQQSTIEIQKHHNGCDKQYEVYEQKNISKSCYKYSLAPEQLQGLLENK